MAAQAFCLPETGMCVHGVCGADMKKTDHDNELYG